MFLCGRKFSPHLSKYLGTWLLDPMTNLCLVLSKIARLSSKVASPFCILTSNEWESSFALHLSPAFHVVIVLGYSHSNGCVVVAHCCFNQPFVLVQLTRVSSHLQSRMCTSHYADKIIHWNTQRKNATTIFFHSLCEVFYSLCIFLMHILLA